MHVIQSPPPNARPPAARALWLAFAAAAIAVPFTSCGERSPSRPQPAAAVDTSAIDVAIIHAGLDAEALFPLGEVSLIEFVGPANGAAAPPVAFRRFVPRADVFNGYNFANPDPAGRPLRVVAGRCRYQKGILQLVKQLAPDDPTPGDSTDRLVDKQMRADWMRNIELRRADFQSPWLVTAAGAAWLLVEGPHPTAIDEVRLQSGATEIVMSVTMDLDSLAHLSAAAPATVTARSRDDRHVVVLHDASGSHILRRTAPNTFSGPLAIGAPGLRHFTVEVLSDSCLFDDDVRVTQQGWTFLCAVDP